MASRSFENPLREAYNAPLVDTNRLTMDRNQLRQDLPSLFAVHSAVKAALEQARAAKALGSSLQASVVVTIQQGEVSDMLHRYLDELDAMFVVSSVDVNGPIVENPEFCHVEEFEALGQKGTVHVLPAKQEKCVRCWRYLAEEAESLCGRCEDVVGELKLNEASKL
jgi:isoleucyl-tRNA synthetase